MSAFKNFSKSTWVIFLVVMIFYGVLLGTKLYRENFDFSSFIVAGDKFSQAENVPSQVAVLPDSWGYDGQFYYRLALDPFTATKTAFGIILDVPSLRQQRILYPFLVWLVSFGKSSVVPIMMVLVNFVMLGGITLVGMRLLRHYNQSSSWAVLFSLYPGFFATVSRDLTEIVATFFLLLGCLWYFKKNYYASAAVLVLAVLTRETTLFFPAAVSLYFLTQGIITKNKRDLPIAALYFIPIVVYAVWQFILYKIWGDWPFLTSTGFNIGLPLKAMVYNFYHLGTLAQKIKLFEIGYVVLVIFFGARHVKKSGVGFPIKIAWLAYLFLFLFYTKSIWVEDWSFLRASTELYTFTILILLEVKKFWYRWTLLLGNFAVQGILFLKLLF